MDALCRIGASVWTALAALIVSRAALATAHFYGWYPEKILAARVVAINRRIGKLVGRLVVRFERPPIVPDAPGLVWKRRKDGWLAIWKPRPDVLKRGYPNKKTRLAVVGECSSLEKEFISDMCTRLQYDMLQFKGPAPRKRNRQQEDLSMKEILRSIRRIIATESPVA